MPVDFFRYITDTAESTDWGVVVTGGGQLRNRSGEPYPPTGHPADHSFDWNSGRVLGAWQLVYIAEGSGEFESARSGRITIPSQTMLMLNPDEWHRYRPDPQTGWLELWVELRGTALGALGKTRLWDSPIPSRPLDAGIALPLLRRIHDHLRAPALGFDARVSAWAWQLLAELHETSGKESHPANAIEIAVRRAEALLAERVETPPNMPELARELGVAYSYFRREFKHITGLAPKAYLQRLRLEKAKRLLGASSESVKSLADRFGFNSPYHFSAAFKNAYGLSPDHWRRPAKNRSS